MGRTFLLLTQAYPPDPTSVGQHIADAAAELVRRGHRAVVLTADRGYDDPAVRFPRREVLRGVEVYRLPWCSFGKGSIAIRLIAGFSFVVQSIVRGLFVRHVDTVIVSTVPPMAPIAGCVLSVLRRARLKFWVMDLNPDQLVALGLTDELSLTARLFDGINHTVLGRATDVIVLDRFMADRVLRKRDVRNKLTILPPWPLSDHLEPVPHEQNPFRAEHDLAGKLVVMYSGNHSPTNPLTTVLQAAERVADDSRLVFLFVGGGIGKREVEASSSPNIRSLPYQPLDRLKYSLSAADIHLVTMGEGVVGIVHPCKVYGALEVGRPVLFVGPEPSHISDIIAQHRIGWRVVPGDVAGAERLLRSLPTIGADEMAAMGAKARAAITEGLSKEKLCGPLVDILERGGEGR
jgi:putative colanic acid biosynthesis glycosyltransferase WcaI